jgi:hypothetical protein
MRITIIEDTDAESMYGSDDDALVGVDLVASEDRYLEAIADAVHAAYPTAELEVLGEPGGHIPGHIMRSVRVDGGEDEERDELAIDEIRHEVWESFEWVVYV